MTAESEKPVVSKQAANEILNAIFYEELETIERLLDGGFPVNARIEYESDKTAYYTLLHDATSNQCPKSVKFLILKGAEIDARDSGGSTPLIWAANDGQDDAVRLLIKAGADLDIRGKDGDTALHCAVNNGHEHICQTLLNAGALVNVMNEKMDTPLHASLSGFAPSLEAARLLLGAGADTAIVPEDGNACADYLTPFQQAFDFAQPDTILAMYEARQEDPYQICRDGRSLDDLVEAGFDESDKKRLSTVLRAIRTDYEIKAAVGGEVAPSEVIKSRRRSELAL